METRICPLKYYKIDLSFSIKPQEINSNVCKEYKTERQAQTERSGMPELRAPGALKFASKASYAL